MKFLFGLLLIVLISSGTLAHEMMFEGPHVMYPPGCCSNKDCHPALPGTIKFTPEGWYITTNKQTIPDDKVMKTPLGVNQWYICHYEGNDSNQVVFLYSDGLYCIWKPSGQF